MNTPLRSDLLLSRLERVGYTLANEEEKIPKPETEYERITKKIKEVKTAINDIMLTIPHDFNYIKNVFEAFAHISNDISETNYLIENLAVFKELENLKIKHIIKSDGECSICMNDLKENDKVIQLKCSHHYHLGCFYPWFKEGKTTCPYCRTSCLRN